MGGGGGGNLTKECNQGYKTTPTATAETVKKKCPCHVIWRNILKRIRWGQWRKTVEAGYEYAKEECL